jgi:type VI secretion system secreted protein VgrG
MSSRALTPGETTLLRSVFGSGITYSDVKIHDEKWMVFQPGDTAMTPNGEMYWPKAHYRADFSREPLGIRAWFVHEGAHLYQYYGLHWSVIARGIFDRNYDYKLDPSKTKLSDYGLEEMGDIARDYYILKMGGTIGKAYTLSDYAKLLPIP